MMAIIGWSLAVILGFLLAVIQWSWRKHAMESLAQSEFVAMLFLQTEIYENNRRVFLEWTAGLPSNIQIPQVMAAFWSREKYVPLVR